MKQIWVWIKQIILKLLRTPLLARWIVFTSLRLHNKSYQFAGNFSEFLEADGLHPKHRLMKYHEWFMKRLQPEWKILDIGCGNGALAYDLKSCVSSVVGIDINADYIERAKRQFSKPGITYLCGDATQAGFDESFDAIVLSNVLEHIEHRVVFLKAIFASQDSRDPPILLLRVPMINRDWITLYKKEQGIEWRLDLTHYTEYTMKELEHELGQAGLEIQSYQIQFGEFYGEIRKQYLNP